jgi:hypothetical protein
MIFINWLLIWHLRQTATRLGHSFGRLRPALGGPKVRATAGGLFVWLPSPAEALLSGCLLAVEAGAGDAQ